MAKKKSSTKQQRERALKDEQMLAKINAEKSLIYEAVNGVYQTAGLISVSPEFKEVSFDVYQSEFEATRSKFSTNRVDFTLDRVDKFTGMLYFKYEIKESPDGK